jgi:hypothetical protein
MVRKQAKELGGLVDHVPPGVAAGREGGVGRRQLLTGAFSINITPEDLEDELKAVPRGSACKRTCRPSCTL